MEVFEEPFTIPINLIRHWCFCPRIVYYQELLQLNTYKPTWVYQGGELHSKIQILEERRGYKKYGLETAIRHFNISLKDPKYLFHGIADWVLETENQVYVVEYKSNLQLTLGYKLQLCAYSLLAQEYFKKSIKTGFLISDNTSIEIEITGELIAKLNQIVKNIHQMLNKTIKPNSSATEAQCIQCEYINYCNDR